MASGPAHVGANWDNFALGVDNGHTGETAGGLYVTARGGKPAIEGDALGNGVGVQGSSGCCDNFGQGPGTGVQGISGTGVGVEAISQNGLALAVRGKAGFSTAGRRRSRRERRGVVANPAVAGDSHVAVTLTGDPGTSQVSWVERNAGSGFTVHLSTPVKKKGSLPLTYLIVEPM